VVTCGAGRKTDMIQLLAQLLVLIFIAFRLGVAVKGDKAATDYIASVLVFAIDAAVLYFAGAFCRIVP
jgi:hypothetical protein